MKTHILGLLFLLLGILTTSCQNILLMLVGIHKPQIENKTSIQTFLIRSKQDTANLYALNYELFQAFRDQPFKPGWTRGFRPIQIRVYNKIGTPIMHWASCEGYLKQLKTFDTVPPRNQINLDSTINLRNDLNRYYSLNGTPSNIATPQGYDYYFVIYFSLSAYRLSKYCFQSVRNYCVKHPEIKIKTYLINVDVMDWWGVGLQTDYKIHH